MAKRVQLLFDFVSPNAYLIWWPLRDLVRRSEAEFDVFPVFLAGMHRLTGNAPPMIRDAQVKGKNEYAMLEMRRFVIRYRLSHFRMNPKFPFNSIKLQRMLYAADQDGRGVQFAESLLPEIWERGLDPTDDEAVLRALDNAGFDAPALFERAQGEEVRQGLVDNTQQAVDRGAFGIPTVFVDDEMFFGKERLDQIEEALQAR